nr:hypothetical protein [uncultured bacterium]
MTTDPHIHVEQKVLEAGAAMRGVITSMLGRAVDAPSVVTTGCGIEVPYAMTSTRPESVTCLPCRQHAHREYLRFADQVERLSQNPVMPIDGDAVSKIRDLAKRFS